MKVLWRLFKIHIAHHQPCRYVQRPAKGDAQARKVAAYASALHKHFLCRGRGIAKARQVINRLVNPTFNGAHPAQAGWQMAEQLQRGAARLKMSDLQ